VGDSGGSVGVGCQVVKFRGSIMGALGHGVLLAYSMQSRGAGSAEALPDAWKKPMAPMRSIPIGERMEAKESIPTTNSADLPTVRVYGPRYSSTPGGEKFSEWVLGS
jgi:hypothetical protein